MEGNYTLMSESFDGYQELARKTAVYGEGNPFILRLAYCGLGLNGEAGEVAEKIKKLIRNYHGELNEERKSEMVKELGDVLWYISALATELNVKLSAIAELNLAKLADRQKRNVIAGEGDNR